MRDLLLRLQVKGLDSQLLARDDLDVPAAARAAGEREAVQATFGATRPAPPSCRDLPDRQLGAVEHGALGDQLEGELERRRHDLAQVADGHLDSAHATPSGMALRDRDDGLGDRELVHQQILGSGSPTSWSITLLPPNAVSTSTIAGGSVLTSPISAARGSIARIAASA